jgi:hypothetical protein
MVDKLVLVFVSLLFVASCLAQCPALHAAPTGVLSKLRSQYRFGTAVWNNDGYVFWTPNVQLNTVDFAMVIRGGIVNDPERGRDVMCGWAALGYNPNGRGMVGTSAVRSMLHSTLPGANESENCLFSRNRPLQSEPCPIRPNFLNHLFCAILILMDEPAVFYLGEVPYDEICALCSLLERIWSCSRAGICSSICCRPSGVDFLCRIQYDGFNRSADPQVYSDFYSEILAQTDVYAPENRQYMISRFTMPFQSLLNSSYMTLTVAARKIDSKLDFHDMFMDQEVVSAISGLQYDGYPLYPTEFCDPSVCKAPRGKCGGAFTCYCAKGWAGAKCDQRDMQSSVFLKRATPSNPSSPLKSLTKFNMDTKIVSDRDIAGASPSCSDPAFVAMLQSPDVRVARAESRPDVVMVGPNSFASILVHYDYKFQQGPTFEILCQGPKTLAKGSIIGFSRADLFINADTATVISDVYVSDIRGSAAMKKLHLAVPIDTTKPLRFASAFGAFSIISEQFILYGTDDYKGDPVLNRFNFPAEIGTLNLTCIVASDLSDGIFILVQSCDSVPVPKIWYISLDTASSQASIKLVGNFGCPSNADGSALDLPTLLRPEMVVLKYYQTARIDAVVNCQFNGRVGPVRTTSIMSQSLELSSFATGLGMTVGQSAADIAAFTVLSR